MHIHILGICGTFMGGIAAIARQAGHRVTGCDANVYPPMSTQLEAQGIELIEGFSPDQLLQFETMPDLFVIGNVVSRGNPLMEAILNQGLPYTSGPQWLGEQVLFGRHVLAVAGTHGKTTTSAMRLDPEVRRQQILDAAISYFAEAGFGVQTRELSRRLGVSQPLLYRYFPSKQDLINAVFEAVFMSQWRDDWIAELQDRKVPLRDRLLRFYLQYAGATYRPE